MLSFLRNPVAAHRPETQSAMFAVWIDGVGCFWLTSRDRVRIGGPASPSGSSSEPQSLSDIAILSDLKRHHATIVRTNEGYFLEALGPVRVAGREVLDRAMLLDGALIELGRSVRLRFRQPTALSLSARLEFASDHRPAQSVDGIVLLADTCLMGPSEDQHIVCPDWPGQVLLVQQSPELTCRSRLELTINGRKLQGSCVLRSGDIVMGNDWRFRIEQRS
jgi:hypothetical protein